MEKARVSQIVSASIAQYGIRPYNALRRLIRGSGLQTHHLIEKRFAETLGLKASEIPSIAVPRDAHQFFTNAWRHAISYGEGTAGATTEMIQNVVEEVYKDFPELLDATQKYFENLD